MELNEQQRQDQAPADSLIYKISEFALLHGIGAVTRIDRIAGKIGNAVSHLVDIMDPRSGVK